MSGYFSSASSAKTLEYLIRRMKIHVFNVEQVITCALPYHSTAEFVKLVQLCNIDGTSFYWLQGVKEKGAAPPRDRLVTRCTHDGAAGRRGRRHHRFRSRPQSRPRRDARRRRHLARPSGLPRRHPRFRLPSRPQPRHRPRRDARCCRHLAPPSGPPRRPPLRLDVRRRRTPMATSSTRSSMGDDC